jgi:hypothetical protein
LGFLIVFDTLSKIYKPKLSSFFMKLRTVGGIVGIGLVLMVSGAPGIIDNFAALQREPLVNIVKRESENKGYEIAPTTEQLLAEKTRKEQIENFTYGAGISGGGIATLVIGALCARTAEGGSGYLLWPFRRRKRDPKTIGIPLHPNRRLGQHYNCDKGRRS